MFLKSQLHEFSYSNYYFIHLIYNIVVILDINLGENLY